MTLRHHRVSDIIAATSRNFYAPGDGEMGISVWQIVIVAAIVILLFGRGKISSVMGDVAQGIKSFKKGMKEENEEVTSASHEALNPANKGESTAEKRDTATES